MIKKYKDVDIEAVACVHNLQYSSVQFTEFSTDLRPTDLHYYYYLLGELRHGYYCQHKHVVVRESEIMIT